MNSIMVIHPYKYYDAWVFDDKEKGLTREAFIAGADDIIDRMTKDIPDAKSGFTLYFSGIEFPGHQLKLTWLASDAEDGNWYRSKELSMNCWLCPSLMEYFDDVPQIIYAQFKAKETT